VEEAAAGQRRRAFDSRIGVDAEAASAREIEKLHAKIGQLTIENDPRSGRGQAFSPRGSETSASNRRAKLDRDHPDLRRQCAMLGVARSGVYRKPRAANDNDPEAMRRIGPPRPACRS
jgi:hypothetical protein